MADQAEKKIKIKMLRQVGPHAAGSEVDLEEIIANDLCQPSHQIVGNHTQNLQKAVRVEDFAKLKESGNVDISLMTQAEMNEAGLVNRIASPYDTHTPQVALENAKKLEEMGKVEEPKPAVVEEDKSKGKKK